MDPSNRKRTRPQLVTNKCEKKVCVPQPLPTPDSQPGDVNFQTVCEWVEPLEREIEWRMKTVMADLRDERLLVNDNPGLKMTHGGAFGEVEVLLREPEKEPVLPPPRTKLLKIVAEIEIESEDEVIEIVSDGETVAPETPIENPPEPVPEPYVPEPVPMPEPYVPEPIRPQPSYTAPPMTNYYPYRPIVEDPAYQSQHRQAYSQYQIDIAAGDEVCPFYVRDVLVHDPFYAGVRINGLGKVQRQLRQDFGTFPTEWLEKGCPYWQEVIDWIGNKKGLVSHYLYSRYDNERVNFIKYKDGRIKITRNHVNAIIREKFESTKWTPTPLRNHNPDKERRFVIPTAMISLKSPYYAELIQQDMFFPRNKDTWIHVKARDGVEVSLRLGLNGQTLAAVRNGSTVQIHPQ